MPISISEAISNGLARTGDLLFRPFKFKKWLAIAVSATLILAGDGAGVNTNGNPFGGGSGSRGGGKTPADLFNFVKDFFNSHFLASVLLIIAAFLLVYTFYFLSRWLSSRAHFMLFHNLVTNTGEVASPWRTYRPLGNSLFFFRIIWDHISLLISLLIFSLSLFLAWTDLSHFFNTGDYNYTSATTLGLVAMACLMFPYMLLHWFLDCIIFHLALPVMYLRDLKTLPALKIAWHELFRPNLSKCLLYFLCFIPIGILTGIWAFFATLLFLLGTCCTGFILMVIPIVGLYPVALLCLPIITFKRAFKLCFISQFGDAYRITWTSPPSSGFPITLNTPQEPPSPFP